MRSAFSRGIQPNSIESPHSFPPRAACHMDGIALSEGLQPLGGGVLATHRSYADEWLASRLVGRGTGTLASTLKLGTAAFTRPAGRPPGKFKSSLARRWLV